MLSFGLSVSLAVYLLHPRAARLDWTLFLFLRALPVFFWIRAPLPGRTLEGGATPKLGEIFRLYCTEDINKSSFHLNVSLDGLSCCG